MDVAHAAVRGNWQGSRHATQQINRTYAVLIAAQFQGFCRDLYSECVTHLTGCITPTALRPIVYLMLTKDTWLGRGNAHSDNIKKDFGRLGINFWDQVHAFHAKNKTRQSKLELLNSWRNAIVHEDFDPAKLGGNTTISLSVVRLLRSDCGYLAQSFDEVMRRHIQFLIGVSPW